MHSNIIFQISHELKRIFEIATRFLSFPKLYLEIPFSKNAYHTETSQSISNANQSIFSLTSNKIKHQFYFRDLELA